MLLGRFNECAFIKVRVSNAEDTPFLLMDAFFLLFTKGTRFVHSLHVRAKNKEKQRERGTKNEHFVSLDRQIVGNTHTYLYGSHSWQIEEKNDVTLPIYFISLGAARNRKKTNCA